MAWGILRAGLAVFGRFALNSAPIGVSIGVVMVTGVLGDHDTSWTFCRKNHSNPPNAATMMPTPYMIARK